MDGTGQERMGNYITGMNKNCYHKRERVGADSGVARFFGTQGEYSQWPSLPRITNCTKITTIY